MAWFRETLLIYGLPLGLLLGMAVLTDPLLAAGVERDTLLLLALIGIAAGVANSWFWFFYFRRREQQQGEIRHQSDAIPAKPSDRRVPWFAALALFFGVVVGVVATLIVNQDTYENRFKTCMREMGWQDDIWVADESSPSVPSQQRRLRCMEISR